MHVCVCVSVVFRWSFYKRISSACVHRLSDFYRVYLQIEAISELCGKQVANSSSFASNSCMWIYVPSIFIFGWILRQEIVASCSNQYDNNNFIDKDVIALVLLDRKFTSHLLFTHAFSCVSFGNNNSDNSNNNSTSTSKYIPSEALFHNPKSFRRKTNLVCYSIILCHFFALSLDSHFWYLRFLYFFRSFRFFWIDYYIVSWFSPISKCECV